MPKSAGGRRPSRLLFFLLLGIGLTVLALILRHEEGTVLGLSSHDFSRLSLLVAVLVFVGAGFFVRSMRVGEVVQAMAFWFMAIVVLSGLYAFRDDLALVGGRLLGALAPGTPMTGRLSGDSDPMAVAMVRSMDGHFGVRGEVNGTGITFLVDTGASFVTLTGTDAGRVGIDPSGLNYSVPVRTANGTMQAAPVRIERIAVGNIERRNIEALVAPAGALEQSLLGLSFLDTLRTYSVSGDRLVLHP